MGRRHHNVEFLLQKEYCNGKTCYTKREAETARNKKLRGYRNMKYLRVYCCPDCGKWHLTHVANAALYK